MINTVLGQKEPSTIGKTLMHEHIIWDWDGQSKLNEKKYTIKEVTDTMVPYLLDLKRLGCQTLVEATPYGAGRDIEVLKACAERTGINIITNCGVWDGGKYHGKYVPDQLKNKNINEISQIWINEFKEGIEGTNIRPGFIKLGLGDEGFISEMQERFLRAAARTSLATGLTIECHIGSPISAIRAVEIIEEERLPFNKFAWIHIDWSNDYDTIFKLASKGIWVEIDAISAFSEPYDIQINLLEKLIQDNFLSQILISQDAGCYEAGTVKDTKLRSYNKIFTEFTPLCLSRGTTQKILDVILTENTARALNID